MTEGIDEVIARKMRENPPPPLTEQQVSTIRALLDPPADVEAS